MAVQNGPSCETTPISAYRQIVQPSSRYDAAFTIAV